MFIKITFLKQEEHLSWCTSLQLQITKWIVRYNKNMWHHFSTRSEAMHHSEAPQVLRYAPSTWQNQKGFSFHRMMQVLQWIVLHFIAKLNSSSYTAPQHITISSDTNQRSDYQLWVSNLKKKNSFGWVLWGKLKAKCPKVMCCHSDRLWDS